MEKVGLVVDSERPYIACSPDGYVGMDLLVEVKCPYVAREHLITPLTVPYLEMTNGQLGLKWNHNYMFQIQGQMHVTGRHACDLVIFTLLDQKIISITYDAQFVKNMLSKLDSFFQDYFKPALLNRMLFRNSNNLCT